MYTCSLPYLVFFELLRLNVGFVKKLLIGLPTYLSTWLIHNTNAISIAFVNSFSQSD